MQADREAQVPVHFQDLSGMLLAQLLILSKSGQASSLSLSRTGCPGLYLHRLPLLQVLRSSSCFVCQAR